MVTIVGAVYAIIDWKKGHPTSPGPRIDSTPIEPGMSAEEYGSYNMTSTPDPFLPHTRDNGLATNPHGTGFPHLFNEDGRASASTFESRDIAALQPTEPNMSMTSFNGNGRGNGVIVTPPTATDSMPGYPLQNMNTNHSAQAPLGVVVISSGRSEDGRSTYAESTRSARSRDGTRGPTNNHHIPPKPSFRRQDSRLSQRSMNSIHSHKSFSRPGPVQGLYAEGKSANPSQVSMVRENLPPIPQTAEPGVAM